MATPFMQRMRFTAFSIDFKAFQGLSPHFHQTFHRKIPQPGPNKSLRQVSLRIYIRTAHHFNTWKFCRSRMVILHLLFQQDHCVSFKPNMSMRALECQSSCHGCGCGCVAWLPAAACSQGDQATSTPGGSRGKSQKEPGGQQETEGARISYFGGQILARFLSFCWRNHSGTQGGQEVTIPF